MSMKNINSDLHCNYNDFLTISSINHAFLHEWFFLMHRNDGKRTTLKRGYLIIIFTDELNEMKVMETSFKTKTFLLNVNITCNFHAIP